MTTEGLPGVAELRERFATFRYSLFRLEALQLYAGSGEEGARAAFEAGEDVRIIPVPTGGGWPPDVPPDDFWLIDSSELWSQRYDQRGTWLGVDLVTDPAQTVQACRTRDAALHHSLPWADYLHHHPEIVSYLAATADQA